MKFILLFLCFLMNAGAWEIKTQDGERYLHDELLKSPVQVIAHPEKTEVEVKKLSEELLLITYLENIAGTTSLHKIYNCAVFHKKTKTILFKDETCKVVKLSKEGSPGKEAKFTVSEQKLMFEFEDSKEEFKF